ncbi:MAG TPA: hypothetical protein VFZ75_11050 [Actinomycetota bacterium]|nr:hypothetical protein [Actinomycetota bacterium]
MRKTLIAIALIAIVALLAGPAAAGGKRAGEACAPVAPRASIDNSFAWGSKGSWGTPGEQLRFAINVFNNDTGCGSSTFGVTVSAPDGFSVSAPSTVTVGSTSSVYVWASITSPAGAADGDYPVSATVQRSGVLSAPATSWYKVYSSDSSAPELNWINPADGGALSGRTAYVGFSSKDDHVVRRLRVILDGTLVATTLCDGVTFDCQVSYKWTIRRVRGPHVATFESVDAMGNLSTSTSTFTVN